MMRKNGLVCGVTGLAILASAGTLQAQDRDEIISRDVLFGNPDRAAVRLSPDGATISFLADVDGVMNIWVGPADDHTAARAVTKDTGRGIRSYFWAYTNRHIIYLQDKGGDENNHVYVIDLVSGKTTDLTPFEEILGPDGKPLKWPDGRIMRPAANIAGVSHKFPNGILIGLNTRNPQFHDIYRANLTTGALELTLENPGFAGFEIDEDYNPRFASRFTPDGGVEYIAPGDNGTWDETFLKVPMEDSLTTNLAGFSKDGKGLYMLDATGRDTAALYLMNLDTGERELLAEDDRADISGVMSHPIENTAEAYAVNYERTEWTVIDPAIQDAIDDLGKLDRGQFSITSRTLDDDKWLVAYIRDDGPLRYYMYDRETREGTFLFTNRSSIENIKLSRLHPVVIDAQDGLKLVSYLTLPRWLDEDHNARPDRPLPMVLLVHGGPWARDSWGYNPMHQWLANRGYAVLSVNFRGSTGFGKNFLNASNLEWAGKMHQDLLDAVDWAIEEGIADPNRVGIMGGSYGGYATLVGLTFTPETFACGVDIVGPSNLVTLIETVPPYWAPMIELFAKRVGDLRTEEGRKLLEERSPLNFVDRIKKPLLIGQGANDPRVKQSEADQIVDAMVSRDIPVIYALYPDEGHGFARPENRKSFNAVAEAFLAEHLGGDYQPIDGDLEGSSIQVPHGAADISGLADALTP